MSLVSSKCLFKVWLLDKGVVNDKIAMIFMPWRIIRKNIPTSNAQKKLHSIAKSVQWIRCPYTHKSLWRMHFTVETMRLGGDGPRVNTSNQLSSD